MVENEIDIFGAFDFGDEKLEQPKPEDKEITNIVNKDEDKEDEDEDEDNIDDKNINTDNDQETKKTTTDSDDKNPSENNDEEEQNESLDDESIIEKYGNDVNPVLVRHYEAIKDRLLLDDDFKFDGKNIDDAYEQDIKNRNQAIAQNLIDKLPEKAKNILSHILKTNEDISSEAFDKILESSKEQISFDFETDDDEKNKENAKNFLTSLYKEKGLKERVIKSMLEDLEDEDKLISEAKEEKEVRDNEASKRKQEIIDAEVNKQREEKEKARNFKTAIDKELEGLKYSKEKVQQIKDTIFTIDKDTKQSKAITILQKIWSKPKALVVLSELLNGYDEKTEDFKLERLENKIKSEKNKDIKTALEEKLTGNGFKNNTQSRKNTTNIDWNDIEIV